MSRPHMSHQFPHPEQGLSPAGQGHELPASEHIPNIGGAAVSGMRALENSNVVGWRPVSRTTTWRPTVPADSSGVVGWRPARSAGETGTERREGVTQDDEYLVDSLLYRPGGDVYDILVKNQEYSTWPEGAQARAAAGICELIQAEYEPGLTFGSKDKGAQAMRSSLGRLIQDHPDSYRHYAATGRMLEYQTTSNPEKIGDELGDFLYFGVRTDPPEGQTRIPDGERVYVKTKVWAAGETAAAVIRAARGNGYEPYGKAFDQSTVDGKINMREDRLLFIAESKEQEAILLKAIGDLEAQHPELFEDEPLIMSESAGIRGVGVADNPPSGDLKLSHNERAEGLVMTAWNTALDTWPETRIPGDTSDISLAGRAYRSNAALKLLTDGKITKQELIARYQDALRATAPQYGLSSENVMRNAPSRE